MKQILKQLTRDAALRAHTAGDLPSGDIPEASIDVPKVIAHGDFSANIAMVMAKLQKMPPRKIAEIILSHIQDPDGIIEKMEIAGPGFINFFISADSWLPILNRVSDLGAEYGRSDFGKGQNVQVEFVSANPTGPLHVGHGRGAVVGDAVASVLTYCGFNVQKEYYINDSGRQIRTLGRSVYLRLKQSSGDAVDFPDDCYQGDYIKDISDDVIIAHPGLLDMPEDDGVATCARFAANVILDGIRSDLEAFGVHHDAWYSEQTLYDRDLVHQTMDSLKADGTIYEADGAWWFKTTDYGDEKDRVVIRNTGETTYFASDIAYHKEKFDRGFNRVIDVWGADHHGYIPRVNAAVTACGYDKNQFDVILVQLVSLLRGGQPVAMSTRSGEFVTLKDVVDEVGRDAARFLFLTRHYESALDFDLDLAKKKSSDNPVYYVQYVHARINSILRRAKDEFGIESEGIFLPDSGLLVEFEELQLIKALNRYPEVVVQSGTHLEPHRVTFYLMDLAALFHTYYNKHKVLTDDESISRARLYLIMSIRQVIFNGLTMLGISAPEQM